MFEEMMERARAEAERYYHDYYHDKIEQLSSKIEHLEDMLKQQNIQFD